MHVRGDPSGTARLQGSELKKVPEEFKHFGSTVQTVWKRGVEACASRLERVEKSVRCDGRE